MGKNHRAAGIVAAGCLLACLAAAAQAQLLRTPQGPLTWYFGGEGGWTSLNRQEDSIPGKLFPQTWRGGLDAGVRGGAQWGPLRLEEEFRYQDNDTHILVSHPSVGGRAAYAVMTNLLYDVPLVGPLSAHAGGGVGPVDLHESTAVPILGDGQIFPGDDWVFGYQAIAGVRYDVNASLAIDLDYRYLATTTAHFRTVPGLIVDGVPRGNVLVTSGYASNSVVASLIVHFGAPPPPPPVAAPPALEQLR